MNADSARLDSFYDVVIVGGGIMGACTAYSIARRFEEEGLGRRVMLCEQFSFGHKRGSSHGSSRIIRKSYHESFYVRMMGRAYMLWDEAQAEANCKVITRTGGLDFVLEGSEIETKLKESMKSAGVEFSVLDLKSLSDRFPGFSMPPGFVCIQSGDAGVVNASSACEMFRCLARRHGAITAENLTVESWTAAEVVDLTGKRLQGKLLRTSRGVVHASRIVCTAGAWTAKLLGRQNLTLDPINTTVVYWKTKEGSDPGVYQAEKNAPVFIVYADPKEPHGVLNAYGTPAIEYPGLIKFCLHSGSSCSPEDRLCIPNLQDIEEKLKDLTRTFLPHVDVENHVAAEACMYNNTRDENFILDVLSDNTVLGCGFSGHGFKFGPLIGELLCSLALDEEPEFSLEPFSARRFS